MARRTTTKPPRTDARFPIEYGSEAEFCSAVVKTYGRDVDADLHNIEPARQDIQFVIGDQWDLNVKARRQRLKKPVLTINRLPAFVAQYIGSWLQTETTIKVSPARGGSKSIAEVRQGLIRTVTRTRTAKYAIKKAMENGYICGVGNFKVCLKDAENDVFLRDITFEAIDDPFGVIWDRSSKEPTGADANHCHVIQYMTKDDFNKAYPDAIGDAGWVADEMDASVMTAHGWEVDDMVRVCEFWQMQKEPVTLGLEAETGDVIELDEFDPDLWPAMVMPDAQGNPMIRETVRPYAECYIMTSSQVLEGPYRLDIPRLPVFRVEGYSLQEGSVRYRWGFVRNAKDPQRLHNYWRSVLAEELSKSVATKWLYDVAGGKGQLLDQFRDAHLSNDNVLQFDSSAGGMVPQQVPPPPMNAAVMTEAGMTVQDLKDVTNKHEASLGIQGNEVSGRAITARQRVSELGDVVYLDNMNAALGEAGRVIDALIPVVFDTNRMVKITGDDDVELLQEINGQAGDATPDITVGKYDITYSTGPSYATMRQESVDVLMTLMNTMPQVGNVVADIIVRNLDIPGATEIEERLASMLPPGMVNIERLPARRREAVQQAQEQAAQQAQQQQQMQMMQFQAAMAKLQAEVAELNARAQRQLAQGAESMGRTEIDRSKVAVSAAAVEVDAFEAGMLNARLGLNAIRLGLESAAAETDRAEQRQQAAQTTPQTSEGDTG
jgi:hypothetical protein